MAGTVSKIILAVLCFFLPPLAVGLEAGCGSQLLLNCILLLLFWIPAVLHALWVVFK